MKKVIVTGATGFIGKALCKELASKCDLIIAVVRENSICDIFNELNFITVYCNMSNYVELENLITDRDIDACFHLAWTGSAGNLRSDNDIQLENVKYTCDLIKVCSKLNCKRFIFASSIMEYEIESIMKSELTPRINTMYSAAKVAANSMARILAGYYGVDYIRAIISNVYGPGEKSTRLISSSLLKLLRGEHCSYSEGNQIYDFIYISDAVTEMIEIAEKGIRNRSYYIGSQNPQPLRNFLIEMKNQIDPGIEIGLGEIPFEGISLSYTEFDITAVKRDTGFVPQVSFSEGIKRTIDWLKKEQCRG